MEQDAFLILNRFFAPFKPLSYKRRTMILHVGEVPSGIFYIQEGFVRQFLLSPEGSELTTIIYKPGDLFPLMWVINREVSPRSFETVTPVVLQRAPAEKFLAFLEAEPKVTLKVISRAINRVNALSERLEHLIFGNAYTKVASILFIFADRFGHRSGRKTITIQLLLSHKDIASFLGVTRETVSIGMKKLEKKGIIAYRGRHIAVKNMKKLEKESLLE